MSSSNPEEQRAFSLCRVVISGSQRLGPGSGESKLLDSYEQGVLVTAQPFTPGCNPGGAKGLLQPALTFLL